MFKISEVKAHCDVPCGIYDPIVAQIAALSVVRMVDLMNA
ncbi:MAG TPA: superoxide dismutase, Ni, partial [Epsilonproteobacteria bacterium]|nr:superoxide dismutase, Ni [Campylobacterota bacterium]